MDIVEKLRKDVRSGRILVRSTETITDQEHIFCPPSTLETKELHGRTLSHEMRPISDVRSVNNIRDKDDYPARVNPTLRDIATRVGFLDRFFSGLHSRVTERDVNDSSKRVDTHPDCVSILRTEAPEGN